MPAKSSEEISAESNGALQVGDVVLSPVRGKMAARDLVRRYADLPTLNKMRGKIRKHYVGALDGRPLTLFEHFYSVQAGSVPVQVASTVYAVGAPDWPTLKIAPRRFFSRLGMRLGRTPKGVLVERADFNRQFWVGAADESFAITLLSPEMQAFLLEKTRVRWRIRNSEVVLIYSGALNMKRIAGSLDRLRHFWSLVPPEMDAWTRTAPPPGA
jgi:hypothetical protein